MAVHLQQQTTDVADVQQHNDWQVVQSVYAAGGLFRQSIATMQQMYELMGEWQISQGKRMHKGMPLVWMGDQYSSLGMPWHAFRFTILAFVEDTVEDQCWKQERGAWHRLVYNFGLSEAEIREISNDALEFSKASPELAMWPEIVVSAKQLRWPVRYPSAEEAAEYVSPVKCVQFLLKFLGNDAGLGVASGDTLSYLAASLCSALPGVKKYKKQIKNNK